MLLNTIVKTVKRDSHRGSQSVTTDQITIDIVACVNRAMRDVQNQLPKKFFHKKGTDLTFTVGVAGTPAVYSLASDVSELILLHYTVNSAYYGIQKIQSDSEWIRGIWSPVQATNLPRFYREIGLDSSGYKQIEVFPIPNQTLTVKNEYYRLKGTDLTVSDLNSNLPDIPDQHQAVIEKGALYYFLKGFDDPAQIVASNDYKEERMLFDSNDERDAPGSLALRFQTRHYLLPGFRLDT